MKSAIACAIPIFSFILLGGCGATRPSKYYELTAPREILSTTHLSRYQVTLLIGPILSSPIYRDDRLVYSSKGQLMGWYEYHRWAEPPAELIAEVLLRQIRASGRYRSVHSLRSRFRGDYILRGHLYDFKEISDSGLATRLTIEFELHDTKTGETPWTYFYTRDEPVSAKDASEVVASLNRNVQRAIEESITSLDEYFSTHIAGPEQPGRR